MPMTPEHLASNIALLQSSKYSDMALESKTKKYKLNRSLVCSRSEVIKRRLEGSSTSKVCAGKPSTSHSDISNGTDRRRKKLQYHSRTRTMTQPQSLG